MTLQWYIYNLHEMLRHVKLETDRLAVLATKPLSLPLLLVDHWPVRAATDHPYLVSPVAVVASRAVVDSKVVLVLMLPGPEPEWLWL